MDPILIEVFSPNDELNGGYDHAHFNNDEFDKLLDKARNESDPAKRQLLHIDDLVYELSPKGDDMG